MLIGVGSSQSVKRFDSSGNFIGDFISSGTANLLKPNAIVIRTQRTSSAKDQKIKEMDIVRPTAGTLFIIDPSIGRKIKNLNIRDNTARLVYSHNNASTNISLEQLSDGVYYINVQFQDGSYGIQKIIIKR